MTTQLPGAQLDATSFRPQQQPAPVLTASGLMKTYGTTAALAGVDLSIAAGESVAIMGASGSGKTTLLHCLAGIVTPDAGSVRLDTAAGVVVVNELSESARSALRRTAFGFVFQQGLLIPELTAVENAALPLMLNGMPRPAAEQHAAASLAMLGLAGLESRRIGELSGGQAQRVAIARAQVAGAAVIFADEPTGSLDSHTSAEVMSALIDSTTARGKTLVVVTHDADVAARCSRIIRLRDGHVIESRSRMGADGAIEFIETAGTRPVQPVPASPAPLAPGASPARPAQPTPAPLAPGAAPAQPTAGAPAAEPATGRPAQSQPATGHPAPATPPTGAER